MFCSKSLRWSSKPAWQEYVKLLCHDGFTFQSGEDKVQDLHTFLRNMAVINSSPVIDKIWNKVSTQGQLWPDYSPMLPKDTKFLESKGLVTARDLVSGAATSGTSNPTKFVYDVFLRMYLQVKGVHCQLDGESFLSFLCRNLQNNLTDGFKYCDAFDDCTVRDFLPGQAAQLVELMGYVNPHSLLAELSRAIVVDGTDQGDSSAKKVAKLWPLLM